MMRTLGFSAASLLLLAAGATGGSLADTPFTGSGAITAGAQIAMFDVLLPSSDNYMLQDKAANCIAELEIFANAQSDLMQVGLLFSGIGQSIDGSAVGFYATIDLFESTYFTLEGSFAGLTVVDIGFAAASNPFFVNDTLIRTANGYTGSLVDGLGQPRTSLLHNGWVEAGQYDLWIEFVASPFDGQPYDGTGAVTLSLTTVPTPSTLLAIALPGAFALRRRR